MTFNPITKRIQQLWLFILLFFISLNGFSQQSDSAIDSLKLSIKFSDAILDRDTSTFDSLLTAGIDVNYPVYDGVTPLMYASQEGNLYFIKELLKSGANVNQIPNNKITALQSAVLSNEIEAVQFLLENGAILNTKNRRGESPFISAVLNNNIEIIQLLIDSGASVYDSESNGNTALHYASAFGNDSLIVFLMNAGANPDLKERQGFTPLMIATSQNYNSTAELFVSYGVDLNAVNEEGYSALTIAILNGNAYLAELFLLNGANGNLLTGKTKDHWYYSKGTGKYMRKVLRKSNVKRNLLPVFDDWAGGMKFGFIENYFSTSVLLGVKETKYNLWLQTAFGYTPFVHSSLTVIDQKKYQFWERNYRLSFEVDKYFSFVNTYKKEFGIFAGVEAGYDFGTYRGTNYKPTSELNLLPVGGIYWRQEFTGIKLGYKKNLFQDNGKPGEIEVQFHFYFGRIE